MAQLSVPHSRRQPKFDPDLDRLVDPPDYSIYDPQADLSNIVMSPYSFTYTNTINDLLFTRLVAMQKAAEGGEGSELANALLSLPAELYRGSDLNSLYTLLKGNTRILSLLTDPYMDFVDREQAPTHPPPIQRRAISMTLDPRVAIELGKENADKILGIPTPLQHLSSKVNLGQAVLITKSAAPFKVSTLNDQACRLFSIAKSDAQDSLNILDFLPVQSHSYLIDLVVNQPNMKIKASGLIVELKDSSKLVSLWVETISQDLLVWALEEVPVHDSVPRFFVARGPCTSYTTLDGEILLHSTKFETKPRSIACLVALGPDLYIKNYNHQVFELMLGYSQFELVGKHVAKVLPQFMEFWPFIEHNCTTPGVVFPEHLFRRFVGVSPSSPRFLSPNPPRDPNVSVYAVNKFGVKVCVDIQLRVVSPDLLVLWITYTHQDPDYQDTIDSPKQLSVPTIDFPSDADNENRHSIDDSRDVEMSGASSDSLDQFRQHKPAEGLEARVSSIFEEGLDKRRKSEASLTTVWSSSSIAASLRCSPEPNMIPRQALDDIKVGSMKRTKKISQYELIRELGHGSYGEVKLVWDPTKKFVIAIKSIYKDRILVDTWSRDRELGVIPNEIKILNQLRRVPHPNIVDFLDYFEDTSCYHMEMVPLSLTRVLDLFDFIELKHAQTAQVQLLLIFQQIVSAVAHIHSLGIVHRDLKDENVIIDNNRFVKLIDFGSAAYTRQGPFDVFVGTVDYAAPEILFGEPYEGRAQDNWALGILLYTIMFCETPFRSPQDIMNASLPQNMLCLGKSLIDKLLKKNPHERASAAEVSVEIKQIIYNEVS